MTALSKAQEVPLALLAGRGHRAWLMGLSAHHVLSGLDAPESSEILTDADAQTCAKVLELGAELVDLDGIELVPLAGRDVEAALAEQGLTVLAVAVLPDGSEALDPFGGRAHAETGQIRTVRSPDLAFREDPILLLRIGSVISWTGYRPSSEVRKYGSRDSGNILDIPERGRAWGAETNRLLLGKHVADALQWLCNTRVLHFVMPEVAALVGFDKTCPVHHKDIWEHTKEVTQKAAPDLVVRWAALAHDIGKIWTRTVTRNGRVHFFRHEDHGALLFESIAHRFCLDAELTRRVVYLVANHSRVNLYQGEWTDSAVRRLMRETGGHLDDLLTFSKADFTTKREARIAEMRRLMTELEARLETIRAEDAKEPLLKKGVGDAIIERFGLRPSRAIGDLKRLLEAAVEAGALPERHDDEVYIQWLSTDEASVEVIVAAGGCVPGPDCAQD